VTVDPIDPLISLLNGVAPTSTRVEGRPVPHIRLDMAGGIAQIPGHHDQSLVEIHVIAATDKAATDLAYAARNILDAAAGVYGDAVVSKIITSPPRFNDDRDGRGYVSFPARVFLHPTPA
jgi:hypothetical protein